MKKLFILTFLASSIFQISFAQWSSGANIPEGIRAASTVSDVQNGAAFFYVIGGRNADEALSLKNYRYSLNDNTWQTMADLPSETLGASGVRLDNDIYIIGGGLVGASTRKVRKYNIETNSWSQVADFPRIHSDGDAVKYQDSLIYVVGSYNTERTYVYNKNTDRWREGTAVPSPGFALTYGGLSVFGNKLVYVGGSNGTFSTTYWNNVWIGEIDQNDRSQVSWSAGTSFPGQTRTFFDFQPWENGLILIGGTTDNTFTTFTDENYFYDVVADTWTQLTPKPTAWNTGNAASVFIDNSWKLFCSGGYATEYLLNTEIFTKETLGVNDFEDKLCGIQNAVIYGSKNPTLSFCTTENSPVMFKVVDMQGKVIRSLEMNAINEKTFNISIQSSELSAGTYLINLSQNGKTVIKKFQML